MVTMKLDKEIEGDMQNVSDRNKITFSYCTFRLENNIVEIALFGKTFLDLFVELAHRDLGNNQKELTQSEKLKDMIRIVQIEANHEVREIIMGMTNGEYENIFDNMSYFECELTRIPSINALKLLSINGISCKDVYFRVKKYVGKLPSIIGFIRDCVGLKKFTKLVFTPGNLRVFNVGQACYNVIGNGKGGYIAVDIGLPLSNQKDLLNQKEKQDIINVQQDLSLRAFKAFILTHYDYDHISGCLFMSFNQIKNARWYLFDPSQNGLNPDKNLCQLAKFLLLVLCFFGNVNFVVEPVNLLENKTSSIELFPGMLCQKNCCTKQNQLGISILIDSKGHSAFLPGDSMYDAWNDALKNLNRQFDFCLVPHHGASIASCEAVNVYKTYAIFCYGTHNSYGHPFSNHAGRILSWVGKNTTFATPYFKKSSMIYSFKTGRYYWK